MDPHSYYPDSAVYCNADPDPAAFLRWIQIQFKIFVKNDPMNGYLQIYKKKLYNYFY